MSSWNQLADSHLVHAMYSIVNPDKDDVNQVDYLLYRFCPGNVLEIVDIVVNSQRGVGKGTAMMRQLEELAVLKGVKVIYAFTRFSNDAAHRFYERLGYVPSATINNFYDGEDAIIYLRRLS